MKGRTSFSTKWGSPFFNERLVATQPSGIIDHQVWSMWLENLSQEDEEININILANNKWRYFISKSKRFRYRNNGLGFENKLNLVGKIRSNSGNVS